MYQNLDENDRNNFNEQLRTDISKSIPIDDSRLTFLHSFTQYDQSYEKDLFNFAFMIHPPSENDFNKKSSYYVLKDFNDLFKNYLTNGIESSWSILDHSKYIDPKYGITKIRKYYLFIC